MLVVHRRVLWFGLVAAFLASHVHAQLRDTDGNQIPGTVGIGLAPNQELDNLTLRNLDAFGANLQNSSFRNSDLSGARLVGDFTGVKFENTNLTNTELSGVFEGADFTGSIIKGTTIDTNTRLTADQFYSTTSFQTGDLQGITFESAALGFVVISNSDLSGWDLAGKDLSRGSYILVNAEDADFTEATLVQTSLRAGELINTKFNGADMHDGDLFFSTATGSDFTGASMIGTDIRAADLTNTKFHGTDLRNASLLLPMAFDPSIFDSNTMYNKWTEFPDGFDPGEFGLTEVETITGDFNADQVVNLDDLNLLIRRRQRGTDPNFDHYIVEDNAIWFDETRTSGYTFDTREDGLRIMLALNKDENDAWLEQMFDLNDDEFVNSADVQAWLSAAGSEMGFSDSLLLGDANLDGRVDSQDLNAVALNWQQTNRSYDQGDFNGDGFVNSVDLNTLANSWQQSVSALGAVAATVPEPQGYLALMIGILAVVMRFRRTDDV